LNGNFAAAEKVAATMQQVRELMATWMRTP